MDQHENSELFWRSPVAAALLGVCLLSACVEEEEYLLGMTESSVVYGEDDRLEYFEHPDERFKTIAKQAAVAFMTKETLEVGTDDSVRIVAESMTRTNSLCMGERFGDQPSAAICSGVLVADDLVLASGHCVRGVPCEDQVLVFGYYYEEPNVLAQIQASDVYQCASIVAKKVARNRTGEVDYAWIRLNRPVEDRQPVEISMADVAVVEGDSLTTIGFGGGLPVKIDSGGVVASSRTETMDYFISSADNFHGASGAGVFNSSAELVGIVSRGADDFVLSPEDCLTVNQLNEESAEEESTYVARAIEGLCESVAPDDRFCESADKSVSNCSTSALGGGAGISGAWLYLLGIAIGSR
ncbi:MAG: trypsin-like peptidase domain-containing protein [Proteobacteria bacterium]|nr:trypsin-like peptidase domain-containing protein [Pseudomonadota bacterium]